MSDCDDTFLFILQHVSFCLLHLCLSYSALLLLMYLKASFLSYFHYACCTYCTKSLDVDKPHCPTFEKFELLLHCHGPVLHTVQSCESVHQGHAYFQRWVKQFSESTRTRYKIKQTDPRTLRESHISNAQGPTNVAANEGLKQRPIRLVLCF